MGGREHNILSGGDAPTRAADYARVLRGDVYALPSFSQTGGPFPGRQGVLTKGQTQCNAAALATIYVALMSDVCIDLAGAAGTIIVEGPAAKDEHFLSLLASLRDAPVERSRETNGVTIGANALAHWPRETPKPPPTDRFGPLFADEAKDYRARWRARLENPAQS
jgi:L-fuculokinase